MDFLDFFSLLTSGVGDLLESESERFLLALAEPFLLALFSCRECLSESVHESLSFLFFDLPFSSVTTELPLSFSFSLAFGFSFFLSDSFSLSFSLFFLSFSWLRLLSLPLSRSLLEAFCLCLLPRLRLPSRPSRLLFLSFSFSFSLSLLRLRLSLALALSRSRSLDLDLLLLLRRSLDSLRSFLWRPDLSALLLLLSLSFSLRSERCLWELWLRLRLRALWEEERLRLLFLRGEEDCDELREDAEDDEDEEDEERRLLWLEVERELLLWPFVGEPLAPRPDRSFPRPECLLSLPSFSPRDLRLSTKGSASLSFASCLCGFSGWPSS